ncbi:MAG: Rrf2 family transcriptional regulator [Holophagaceae bacterium]|nr:Rrf2 family transcriptional regulator [Holophagaceae bacterium]
MLGISRQTDYAARVVLHLACLAPGARVPLADIAKHRMLPLDFVRRIVGDLVKAGILMTSRGSGGGVSLARPAGDISLGEVVEATEGRMALNHCVSDRRVCPLAASCPVQSVWVEATQVLSDYLASVRFDTLALRSEGHQASHLRVQATGRVRGAQRCAGPKDALV